MVGLCPIRRSAARSLCWRIPLLAATAYLDVKGAFNLPKSFDVSAVLGKVVFEGQTTEIVEPNKANLVAEVTVEEVTVYNKGASPKFISFRCGKKHNIGRYLSYMEVELTVVPYDYDLPDSELQYEGFSINNDLLTRLQNRALVAGVTTDKLKYGNCGMNQSCIDIRSTRCCVTSQSQEYSLNSSTLSEG
ncbi:putative carbamoyl-phosphate synthase arginine-specific small chain (CPS-A) [Phytophthora infestans]|nr:putative carbamoyl-phosphate synthase arginine-specific small chain (CPS-A) [Phytophthora infestans]